VTWSRAPVAQALANLFTGAVGGTAYVHERPPEIVNFPSVVVMWPALRTIASVAFGVDEVELPVAVVHGMEQADALDQLKQTIEQAVFGAPNLNGTVKAIWPSREQNWRNVTGAGGVQLLYCELVLTIQM
jgi:hypothetical protein